MNEVTSEIKPAEIYADLSHDDIADMMAEAAMVDALFQSGRIGTMFLTSLSAAACAASEWHDEPAASAA